MYRIGLDVGSTTLKCAVIDGSGKIIYTSYERHFSKITEMTSKLLQELKDDTEIKFGLFRLGKKNEKEIYKLLIEYIN